MTLEGITDGTVELRANGSLILDGLNYRYGTSGEWTSYTPGTSLDLPPKKKIQFWNSKTSLSTSDTNYARFIFSGQVEASGNITSLINFSSSLSSYCFFSLFRGCSTLLSAPDLTKISSLATACCYRMFYGCSSLVQAPILPTVVNLTHSCFREMFSGCSSLVQAPELPYLTLNTRCYNGMFQGCTSLTDAPELPATSISQYCYSGMFQNCTSLSSVEVNFTDWNSSSSSTTNWLNTVAASGTFIKPSALSEERGGSRIPTNWTIINK